MALAPANVIAIEADQNFSLVLKGDGRVAGWGPNVEGPTDAPAMAPLLVCATCRWAQFLAARRPSWSVVSMVTATWTRPRPMAEMVRSAFSSVWVMATSGQGLRIQIVRNTWWRMS